MFLTAFILLCHSKLWGSRARERRQCWSLLRKSNRRRFLKFQSAQMPALRVDVLIRKLSAQMCLLRGTPSGAIRKQRSWTSQLERFLSFLPAYLFINSPSRSETVRLLQTRPIPDSQLTQPDLPTEINSRPHTPGALKTEPSAQRRRTMAQAQSA